MGHSFFSQLNELFCSENEMTSEFPLIGATLFTNGVDVLRRVAGDDAISGVFARRLLQENLLSSDSI